MGIFHFFGFFKKNFSGSIKKLSASQNFEDIKVEIDNLMIDMNGLFHESAQKIYQYGNFKPVERLMKKENKTIPVNNRTQLMVFEDVCKTIEELLNTVKPNKRLILCVDGPAPMAKQIQQKRRRFKSSLDREYGDINFDSNCITPGTQFMDYLSKYIDWYIKKRISADPQWQKIEVIFSSSSVPGEGEHKIISYIRKHGDKKESYCIQGLDADLIMLSLGLHYPKFYILRNDTYDFNNKFFVIDISTTALQLGEMMRWESKEHECDSEVAVDDFIFICFMIGNDFLPHIPSIEIIEDGIDILLSIYRDVGTFDGHILDSRSEQFMINKSVLKHFFEIVSGYEKVILEKKLKNRRFYFPDELLEQSAVISEDSITVDVIKYRKEYCNKHFKDIKKISHSYLDGLNWVITYYKKGVPDWRWYYHSDYAPPASVIAEHIDSYIPVKYKKTFPLTPFQQLLCVLPPKSAHLLPKPLDELLTKSDSPIKKYYPDEFEVDLAGKKNDWQGVVILPSINIDYIIDRYTNISNDIHVRDKRRNLFGKTFVYNYDSSVNRAFESYYGKINCKVKNSVIYL